MGLSIGRGTLLGMGYITVTADTEAAEESLGGFGKVAGVAAGGILAVGAAAATTVVMANRFNNAMKSIQTQAGGTAQDVKVLTGAVLSMKNVQQSPDELAAALYHLKSVGLDNATAMIDLKQASDLASVGNSDLEDTTNALAGAWRSGIQGASTFAMAAGTVNAIIGAGNMRMGDFVAAIGTGILPAAKTFGVSLSQVGASLALMTDEGVPAVDAATRIKMSLSLLAAPSKAASTQLGNIGLTGLQLANEMRSPAGLVGTIGLLKTALDKSGLSLSQQAILLSKAFGGGRSSSAILTMINNYGTLQKKLVQIQTTSGNLAASEAAQQATMSAQIKIFSNNVESFAIRTGETLIPTVTQFFTFVDQTGLPLLGRFTDAVIHMIPVDMISADLNTAEGMVNTFLHGLLNTSVTVQKTVSNMVNPNVLFGTLSTALAPGGHTANPNGTFGTLSSALSPGKPATNTGLGMGAQKGLPLAGGLAGVSPAAVGNSFGAQVQIVLKNLVTGLDDTAIAFGRVAVAAVPLVEFLAGTGFQTLKTVSGIVATVLGPALLQLSKFIVNNKGVITTFIELALVPLGIRLAALSIIRPITAIVSLSASIVKFPFQQSALIWSGITTGVTAVKSAMDTMYLQWLITKDAVTSSTVWTVASNAVSTFADSLFVLRLRLIGLSIWQGVTTLLTSFSDGTALAAVNTALFSDSVFILRIRLMALSIWETVNTLLTAFNDGTALAKVQLVALNLWQGIVAESSKVLAIAQGALNLVMDANPIALVVLALAALGIAFYEAWEHSSTFRTIVIGAFNAVASAAEWLWKDAIEPYFRFIADLWLTVVGTIVQGAADAFSWIPGLGGKLKTAAKAIEGFKNDVNAALGGIQNKTFTAQVNFNALATGGSKNLPGLATGGPVRGPGTATSDDVPILASTGEHVWTAAEVQSAGGHGAVVSMRNAAMAGKLPAFADGGPVGLDLRVVRPTATQITAQVMAAVAKLAQVNASALLASITGAAGGSTSNAGGFSGQATGVIQQYALSQLGKYGWGSNQMGPLIKLWNQESGWNPNAVNPSSGAYGIPQALGHGHPYNLGDYVAQINWGLNYIAGRYGSPAVAWDHEVADNWYDRGGWLMPGTTIAHNGTGKPERVVGPGESTGGGDTYNFHFHGPVGSQQELENWLVGALQSAKQKGRLRNLVGP